MRAWGLARIGSEGGVAVVGVDDSADGAGAAGQL